MIVIADAHVSEAHDNVPPFFEMLERISQTPHDVVFLGDIFELWIGLPRYESSDHSRFIQWCAGEKKNRSIGFIEGNHEFFVTQKHKEAFCWSSTSGHLLRSRKILFVHGDLINRKDKNYLRFRAISKNWLAKWIIKYLPTGPKHVQKLKAKLKKTNQEFRLGLPKEAIESFAHQMFSNDIDQIIVGHFHESFEVTGPNGKRLQVIPDWFTHQSVAMIQAGTVSVMPWKEIPTEIESPSIKANEAP